MDSLVVAAPTWSWPRPSTRWAVDPKPWLKHNSLTGKPGSYADLEEVRALLDELGEPHPELPTVDPETVSVPYEAEIREFIARLREAKDADD